MGADEVGADEVGADEVGAIKVGSGPPFPRGSYDHSCKMICFMLDNLRRPAGEFLRMFLE